MQLKTIILFVAVGLSAAACANPAANKIQAIATNSAAPAIKQHKGKNLTFSADNSKLEFTASKVTGKEDGGFKTFSGEIDLVGSKPEESQVSVIIDMSSVFTGAEGLTAHLKTPDFFDVEKYTQATFVSTKIIPDPDKKPDGYTVTGDLELHGIKKSITYPAKISINQDAVIVESEFFINRRDFNINYDGRANDLIRDEVVLHLNIKAPLK